MCIELFSKEADALPLRLGGVGNGERFKAASFVIAWIVSEPESAASRERPCDMNPAGENTQDESVAGCDVDEHIIRENGRVEEYKKTVLGGFGSRNVSPQPAERSSEFRVPAAESPPELPSGW